MKNCLLIILASFILCAVTQAADKKLEVHSPDNNIKVNITAGKSISYQVSFKGIPITLLNTLSLTYESTRK